MSIVEKNVKIAEETNDVMTLIVETVKAVRGKQDYSAVVDDMVKAIEGVSEIDDEFANRQVFINTIGGRVGDIYDAFIKKEETPADPS